MAKKSGLGQQIFVHGYDLSGDVAAIDNASSPRGLLDSTAINASAHERIMGLSDGNLAVSSWFNDSAEQEHAAYKGLPTTDRILTWAFWSNPRGCGRLSCIKADELRREPIR
tara:strand:+ start:856 stop:1191 length:336 start_codon:yes stop_codon:yes gene_type:complete